ncbi:MAG: hypothetical protein P1P74_09740 [Desulfuromonadales bacterium]|nr:hypothetical protein [Desulfuromonadales bacterium]MDT8423570.1 hypothetical protein [Desulfuromonadales bacterium]
MELFLSKTTMAIILFLCAGIIQSFCYMNKRLPAERRSPVYPTESGKATLLNLSWIFQAVIATVMTMPEGPVRLGVTLAIYFLVLPFVVQIPMARMLGFKSFRAYMAVVDGQKK